MQAISRVIDSTAPFDAVYAICGVAAPTWATNEATLITLPPPDSSIAGMPCRQHRATPVTLTSSTVCHVSSLVLVGSSSSPGEMPALLYSTVSAPNVDVVCSTARRTLASSPTSSATNEAAPPRLRIAVTASVPSDTSPMTTLAPSDANNSAATRPSPLAAPVMSATLPASRPGRWFGCPVGASLMCWLRWVVEFGGRTLTFRLNGPNAVPRSLHPHARAADRLADRRFRVRRAQHRLARSTARRVGARGARPSGVAVDRTHRSAGRLRADGGRDGGRRRRHRGRAGPPDGPAGALRRQRGQAWLPGAGAAHDLDRRRPAGGYPRGRARWLSEVHPTRSARLCAGCRAVELPLPVRRKFCCACVAGREHGGVEARHADAAVRGADERCVRRRWCARGRVPARRRDARRRGGDDRRSAYRLRGVHGLGRGRARDPAPGGGALHRHRSRARRQRPVVRTTRL